MPAIRYIKNKVPPHVKRPIRKLFDRWQNITRFPFKLTHEEIAALIKKPNPTILEIGCNDGTDTLAFLRVMPQAQIYCFEPDPRAIRRFKKRMESHLDKVRLFEVAVSNQTGQIDFYQSTGPTGQIDFYQSAGGDLPERDWDLSGSIRRPKYHLIDYPWVKFEKTITVSSCRLDDWYAENGVRQVDFIWMDVQGAEGDVIAGAPKILEETRFLHIEYGNNESYEGQLSYKKLLARLPSFEVVTRYPEDVLLRNRVAKSR
jgi:2-O-methyltransferase